MNAGEKIERIKKSLRNILHKRGIYTNRDTIDCLESRIWLIEQQHEVLLEQLKDRCEMETWYREWENDPAQKGEA